MLIGSAATSLCSAGGFCAGSAVVIKHQVNILPVSKSPNFSSLACSASMEPLSYSLLPRRPLSPSPLLKLSRSSAIPHRS